MDDESRPVVAPQIPHLAATRARREHQSVPLGCEPHGYRMDALRLVERREHADEPGTDQLQHEWVAKDCRTLELTAGSGLGHPR